MCDRVKELAFKNNEGKTARQIAKRKNHDSIAILCSRCEILQKDRLPLNLSMDTNDIHSLVFFNDTKRIDEFLQASNSIND